ncbi:hypothetical protein HDV63DRAFT_366953 [Trichoderma sp. SZMC 28014]
MHTGVVRTSLCADLALSLAFTCLINTLVGALAVLPWHRVVAPQRCSQWDGLADVVPPHWVGQCRVARGGRIRTSARSRPSHPTESPGSCSTSAIVMVLGRSACLSWSYFASRKGLFTDVFLGNLSMQVELEVAAIEVRGAVYAIVRLQ